MHPDLSHSRKLSDISENEDMMKNLKKFFFLVTRESESSTQLIPFSVHV